MSRFAKCDVTIDYLQCMKSLLTFAMPDVTIDYLQDLKSLMTICRCNFSQVVAAVAEAFIHIFERVVEKSGDGREISVLKYTPS